MKHTTYLSLLVSFTLVLSSCTSNSDKFVITNDSEFERTDEPIVLKRDAIISKTGTNADDMLPVVYYNDELIPSQFDDIDQDGSWDELAFTLHLSANESKSVTIQFVESSAYPSFPDRTNVRFGVKDESGTVTNRTSLSIKADEVPTEPFARFQMDGPAWENDKIGFRQYIDGRNARDLYGKKLSTMALDTVGISATGGLEDNYHVMRPWGRDILAVGNSLGLGGIGILKNDEAVRVGVRLDDERNNVDLTSYQLITEGPVRSIFKLSYEGWQVGNEQLNLDNTVTIWAGSYSYKNTVTLYSDHTSDTLLVGLVNINNDLPPVLNKDNSAYTVFSTFDKQTYDKDFYLGMALAFPSDNYLMFKESPESGPGITNTYLNYIELTGEKTFGYYAFAGWELSIGKFTDPDNFREYITKEVEKLANPVTVK